MRVFTLLVSLLLCGSPAWANIVPIDPFTGTWSEDFSGINTCCAPALTLEVMSGHASISGWMGTSGQALSLNWPAPNPSIAFAAPVSAFGAYWMADTSYGVNDAPEGITCCGSFIPVSFYGVGGGILGGTVIKYTKNANFEYEPMWFGWESTEPIESVSFFVPDHFVWLDGLQATAIPEPAPWLMMGLGLVSLVARGKRAVAFLTP